MKKLRHRASVASAPSVLEWRVVFVQQNQRLHARLLVNRLTEAAKHRHDRVLAFGAVHERLNLPAQRPIDRRALPTPLMLRAQRAKARRGMGATVLKVGARDAAPRETQHGMSSRRRSQVGVFPNCQTVKESRLIGELVRKEMPHRIKKQRLSKKPRPRDDGHRSAALPPPRPEEVRLVNIEIAVSANGLKTMFANGDNPCHAAASTPSCCATQTVFPSNATPK